MHPIVAIVGRPNVGKSRLFNRIVGRRVAIVADEPGVTRDRHYALAEWVGREFIAVDTGGLDLDPAADLEHKISKQSLRAIEEADVVVCVFDGQNDPTSSDREIVAKLRGISKPVIFVVNKVDEDVHENAVHVYHELGAKTVMTCSAEHGRGVDELLEKIVSEFPKNKVAKEEKIDGLSIAVVGKPNVGKSTLINRLAGEERVIAHEMPGTTRDAINVEIDFEDKKYVFIDTAGVKKRFAVADRLEKFTAMRSLKTIDRAGLVLQLIDAAEGLTKQDLHLTGFAQEQGKGILLLVNKWDLLTADWEEYEKRLRRGMGDLADIAMFPISASKGYNCLNIFKEVEKISRALSKKISTSQLNKILEEALSAHHLPVHRGKPIKIYYATQVGVNPPTFALFSNFPAAVPYTYRRYLVRKLQDALGIRGVPVKIVCRRK